MIADETNISGGSRETRLESWKEIAAYLQRNNATVRRWEKEEGLPVHRHSHNTRSSVYAYPSEINAWRAGRRVVADQPPTRPWWRPVAVGVTALLCLMMVGNGIRPQVAAAQRAQVVRQIQTSNFKGDFDSVSLDGRYLTGTDWSTGDVVVHDLKTGATRHATHDGKFAKEGGDSDFSVISPDGRQIIYSWDRWGQAYELRVMRLGTAENARPEAVYSNPETDYIEPEAWTPDGKQVLVVHTLKDQTNQLGILSILEKSLKVVKSFGLSWPECSLSPDGRYIAYSVPDARGTKKVSIMTVDGAAETVLEQKTADSYAPLWAPDGSRVVFSSDRTGVRSLWSVLVVSGKPAGVAELLKSNVGSITPLGITRKGVLYYALADNNTNLYTAELDSALKVAQAPQIVSEKYLNSNSRGSWSLDGQYLAYYSFRGTDTDYSRNATLVIRAMASGEERDIDLHLKVPIHAFASKPRWFPDGRSVLVVAVRPLEAGYGYYRVDLDSGKSELLHHTNKLGIPEFEPDLSPDGKTIFYASNDSGATRLMRFDIGSREETKLLAADHLVSPAVSPDGTQLAYIQDGSVTLLPIAGGTPRVLYHAAGVTAPQSNVTWMPDQRHLLFVQSAGAGEKDLHILWRVPLDGSKPEEIGLRRTGGYAFVPAVHPDGRRIAFASHEGTGEPAVWALENFLPRAGGK